MKAAQKKGWAAAKSSRLSSITFSFAARSASALLIPLLRLAKKKDISRAVCLLGTCHKDETTASLARNAASTPEPTAAAENDLAYARAAATRVLDGKATMSVPWENPRTGARGTVTPLASAYTQDGFVCRDFLASYVHQGAVSWLQGEGCRVQHGKWEVRVLRPWKKA